MYRPFSGGSWKPFSRASDTSPRLPGGVRLRSLEQRLNSHFTNVRWTTPAFDFRLLELDHVFAKAFEEVLRSTTAYPTSKSAL